MNIYISQQNLQQFLYAVLNLISHLTQKPHLITNSAQYWQQLLKLLKLVPHHVRYTLRTRKLKELLAQLVQKLPPRLYILRDLLRI